jgi:hypothetical protein
MLSMLTGIWPRRDFVSPDGRGSAAGSAGYSTDASSAHFSAAVPLASRVLRAATAKPSYTDPGFAPLRHNAPAFADPSD